MVLVLTTIAAVAVPPAAAQIAPDAAAAAVDGLFAWASPDTPGCEVAVAQNGVLVVDRSYGSADLDHGTPLGVDTRLDVGSVQKQFVAAAVLLLAEDGRVSLDDDVRRYVPEMPDVGHVVTLDHLLTHTGGVRDWVALQRLADGGGDALSLIVRQRGLNFAPGTEWSYSNSGYVLLKEVVARVAGVPFSRFVRERLFEPLGMTRTVYADDVREVEDRSLAYERDGDGWRLDVLEGDARGDGGGLFSTARDLVVWSEALADGRLGAFVSGTIQAPARLANGRELTYARGLFLDEGPSGPVVWHTGSAAAYKSFLARLVDQDLSVALLCNGGEGTDRDGIANAIADLFVPPAEEPAAPVGREGVDVSGKEGVFVEQQSGETLRLAVRDGRLQIPGGAPLLTVAEDRFQNASPRLGLRSDDAFELRFVSDDAFDLVSMEGEATRYHRADPYAPDTAERAALEGRYESDELATEIEVEAAADGLSARLNGSRSFAFAPVMRDRFEFGPLVLHFERDGTGAVVGLAFSNPALRRVAFERVGDVTSEAGPEQADEAPAEADPEALVGFYQAPRPGNGVAVSYEDGTLYAEPTGRDREPLVHQSGTTYFVGEAGSPMRVAFTLNADGLATEMVLLRGEGPGRTFPKTR